jgi:hypothetical protein
VSLTTVGSDLVVADIGFGMEQGLSLLFLSLKVILEGNLEKESSVVDL